MPTPFFLVHTPIHPFEAPFALALGLVPLKQPGNPPKSNHSGGGIMECSLRGLMPACTTEIRVGRATAATAGA